MFWASKEKLLRCNFDIEKIAEQGMFFHSHQFKPNAPTHLYSFLDCVSEYLLYIKDEGAHRIVLDDLVPYIWYFSQKDPDSFVFTELERFFYKMNYPIFEPMCIDISIYDTHYLKELFGNRKFPDGTSMGDHIDEIREFQKYFLREANRIVCQQLFRNPGCTILFYSGKEDRDSDFMGWVTTSNLHGIL